jgi:hypothetical protein
VSRPLQCCLAGLHEEEEERRPPWLFFGAAKCVAVTRQTWEIVTKKEYRKYKTAHQSVKLVRPTTSQSAAGAFSLSLVMTTAEPMQIAAWRVAHPQWRHKRPGRPPQFSARSQQLDTQPPAAADAVATEPAEVGPAMPPEFIERPATDADLFVGLRVRIHGLKSKPAFNRLLAIVNEEQNASGRWAVQCHDGKWKGPVMALKAENLLIAKPLPGDPTSRPTPAAAAEAASAAPPPTASPHGKPSKLSLPASPMWRPQSQAELSTVFWLTACSPGLVGGMARGNAAPSFERIQDSSWRDQKRPTARKEARWTNDVCGGCVHEVDMRTEAGRKAACAAVEARRPIVMRHAAGVLQPTASEKLSSLESIGSVLGDRDVTVLRSGERAKSVFTYYHDHVQAHPTAGSVMKPPHVNDRLLMQWDEFTAQLRSGGQGVQRQTTDEAYYMQLALAARAGGVGNQSSAAMETRISQGLLAELQAAMRRGEPMHALTKTLGPWTVSNFYVGPAGTLAPCHYDALDNTFLQLGGRKDVLLFAPTSEGLRPFPNDHPFGSRANVDLENLDADARAELRGQGALAALNPGDGLFIPNGWWHHIHSRPDNDVSISLNFWFDPSRELQERMQRGAPLPSPPTSPLMLHMAREAESLAIGVDARCDARARFFRSMLTILEGRGYGGFDPLLGGGATQASAEPALARRNMLLHTLVAVFGEEGAAAFCRVFLDPRRWTKLKAAPFLE